MSLEVDRYFTDGKDVYCAVSWTKSDVDITDEQGKFLFKQEGVEFPAFYSPLSRKIVASRYFYGENGTSERESSMRQLVERVTSTFSRWAVKNNYLDDIQAERFRDELASLCLNQRMAFNSPVWFNVGTDKYESSKSNERKSGFIISDGIAIDIPIGQSHLYPQTSACFIQFVDDTMESIMDLAVREAMLFKYGSGTGTDLSTLRSSREKLSGGGKPSGPLQYDIFYDKLGGIVQAGGKTRRAAKMNSMGVSHPDIKEFIVAKKREQEIIELLIDSGVNHKEAVEHAFYQNTNFSIRVTDDFMHAVESNLDWQTIPVHNKEMLSEMPKYNARELLRLIADGTWYCGDPGIQFDTTINSWHTCPNSGKINASNPCSEYVFLDDSSCNLASLNLMGFMNPDGTFNIDDFSTAIKLTTIAQDLEIDNSSYPMKKVAENSHNFRPLGMGYANVGALLMTQGLPYDDDESRAISASITALLTGKVYETSSEIAKELGAFNEYEKNKESMLGVIEKHRNSLRKINREKLPKKLENILDEAEKTWDNVVEKGKQYGFRNAQATVLAPTGTIGFMMDCATKGIEPEIGLVQIKTLSEGGKLKLVNYAVDIALRNLGYDEEQVKNITNYVVENGTTEGSKLREEHLAIFDCANKPPKGKRTISPMGHINMMAAVQPFLSGAISKTVNLPRDVTIEEIEEIYMQAWKKGLKAVAIYRDGSKRLQPLSFENKGLEQKLREPVRRKLPVTAPSIRHKFDISGHEGYLHVGLYEDGTPGELFINMSKEGSTIGGLMDAFATSISMNLQYGVPLETLVKKFRHQRFEPSGIVYEGDKDNIKTASSVIDYIFNFLGHQFLNGENGNNHVRNTEKQNIEKPNNHLIEEYVEKGNFCPSCGTQMNKQGHCTQICPECETQDMTGCGG